MDPRPVWFWIRFWTLRVTAGSQSNMRGGRTVSTAYSNVFSPMEGQVFYERDIMCNSEQSIQQWLKLLPSNNSHHALSRSEFSANNRTEGLFQPGERRCSNR